MPMSVKVLAWKQPADGVLKIGLGAAAGLDQRDAGGRMRNKDVTESVAPVTTELSDHMSDIGDEASSGVQLHDIGVHSPIIAFRCRLARGFRNARSCIRLHILDGRLLTLRLLCGNKPAPRQHSNGPARVRAGRQARSPGVAR